MNIAFNELKNKVEMLLFWEPKKTGDELRGYIRSLAENPLLSSGMNESEIDRMAREIESKHVIKAGLGAIVDSEDFVPWLDDAKPDIDPFYWNRYQRLLVLKGLPKDVVISMEKVTDKILSRLGNPGKQEQWDRRGMVVGHVQSGKTANYTGLICKAADAGYRLIIVIAGTHNNLRNQTQSRIDEGFIGRDTGKSQKTKRGGAKHLVGVGLLNPGKTPVSLTNTFKDFNKDTAWTNTSEIDSYKVPVVLVIKKNSHTLANLLDWLRDNNARGDHEMIDQPMLLIDDEADNASINTKYRTERVTKINGQSVTKINGQIRDLLNMFHRSCYVGYTATPFANIFIDPDQIDEMYNEDLFPRDFIIGLDAPSNYFGPSKIFVDGLPNVGVPNWLRYIHDNEDSLPIKHKIDYEIESLPPSLTQALATFLLVRTIRNLRGQKAEHCSMLVNASRFTAVQGRLRNRLHEKLERIKNAVRINASRGTTALNDPEIAAIHAIWKDEYSKTKPDWETIQSNLMDAIASAKVVEVNSRANDLDYLNSGERGQTVVAVGGYSLSRGLTLEGLTVTWFLRNTMMYDTLMQMGRWFGYRDGYIDLCRIWMPADAIEWYAFITNAAEELHEELRAMEKAKATPQMFGLEVRSHPASLLVTARNKMGSGRRVKALVGLSNKFVETSKVSIKPDDLSENLKIARLLVSKLYDGEYHDKSTSWGTLVSSVPVDFIDEFLAGWRNTEQSVITDPKLVRAYIRARKTDELQTWDVLISSLKTDNRKLDLTLGKPVVPFSRHIDLNDLKHAFMSFSGRKMRVGSRGIEKAGVDSAKAKLAEALFRRDKGVSDGELVNYPDTIYRRQRDRPLFILYLVKATAPRGKENSKDTNLIPTKPVVAWGISLPVSARQEIPVEYVVNTVRLQELFGDEDEDED